MSALFSRVNIISQSQHDAEVANPSVPIPTSRRTYLQVLSDSLNQDGTSDVTTVSTSNSRFSDGWQNRISATEAEIGRQRVKRERREHAMLSLSSKFRVGAHVYTTNPAVAPMPKRKKCKGKRRRRVKVYGKVVMQSRYQPRFWLVKFNNGKQFYCTIEVVHFVSSDTPNNGLGSDSDGNLTTVPFDYSYTDKERLMTSILEMKSFGTNSEEVSEVTFDDVVNAYKGQFSWLDARKLSRHYHLCKHALTNICPKSWASKLEETLAKKKKSLTFTYTKRNNQKLDNNENNSSNKNEIDYVFIPEEMKQRRKERRAKSSKYDSSSSSEESASNDSNNDDTTENYISSLKELQELADECMQVKLGMYSLLL